MKNWFFIFPALFLLFLSLAVSAADVFANPSDVMIPKMLAGQEKLFERDYDGALKIFREVEVEYPDSPGGYFGEMTVFEMKMLEREDFSYQTEFLKAAVEGKSRVSKVMQMYKPDKWDLFLCGALLGMEGLFKARNRAWWDAYVLGTESRQIFKHVKELDPSFVDADFGLGMYIYWRSVFARDLWFLKMIPDRRAEGIAIIENVAKKGTLTKKLAESNLAIAYLEEKRFQDAYNILKRYVEAYPRNVLLRRIIGKTLVSLKRYDEAVEQFRQMLAVDPTFKKPHYFIGAVLVMKGDPANYAQAENELREFLKAKEPPYWQASAHYWLGRLEEKRGKKDAGKKEYETAYKLDPKIGDALKRARALGSGM